MVGPHRFLATSAADGRLVDLDLADRLTSRVPERTSAGALEPRGCKPAYPRARKRISTGHDEGSPIRNNRQRQAGCCVDIPAPAARVTFEGGAGVRTSMDPPVPMSRALARSSSLDRPHARAVPWDSTTRSFSVHNPCGLRERLPVRGGNRFLAPRWPCCRSAAVLRRSPRRRR